MYRFLADLDEINRKLTSIIAKIKNEGVTEKISYDCNCCIQPCICLTCIKKDECGCNGVIHDCDKYKRSSGLKV